MNITAILPIKQNEILLNSIMKQLDESDEIIVFEQPRFASRRIDDAIKKATKEVIFIINPKTKGIPHDFINAVKETYDFNNIYIRRWDDDMSQGFTKCNIKSLTNEDSVWFMKGLYKGALKDFSSHMDFDTVLRTLIRPFYSNIFCPTLRMSKEYRAQLEQEQMVIMMEKQKKQSELQEIEAVKKEFGKKRQKALEEFRKNMNSKKLKNLSKRSTSTHSLVSPVIQHVYPIKNFWDIPQEGVITNLEKARTKPIENNEVRVDEIILEED